MIKRLLQALTLVKEVQNFWWYCAKDSLKLCDSPNKLTTVGKRSE
jgi:hypothetical protein